MVFTNFMEAWESINLMVLSPTHFERGRYRVVDVGKARYFYNVMFEVISPQVDPEFNFGRYFNYTKAKWNSLVKNYVNINELKELKNQILANNKKVYNIPYQFTNNHKHGKECLISLVVTKKAGKGQKPQLSVYMRASEVTKRLICDFLLIQRIGEYLFDGQEFTVVFNIVQMFNDDTVLLMFHAYKNIKPYLKEHGEVELLKHLKSFIKKDPTDVKYKVHKRALKVLRPDLFTYPQTLVKDCNLPLG